MLPLSRSGGLQSALSESESERRAISLIVHFGTTLDYTVPHGISKCQCYDFIDSDDFLSVIRRTENFFFVGFACTVRCGVDWCPVAVLMRMHFCWLAMDLWRFSETK
jgi:hypothetical protein